MNRRDFLRGTGALIVTFSAGGLDDAIALAQGGRGAVDAGQLDSWLAVAADGSVTAYTGKCELGQGMATAQVQLVAEELSVPVARVRLVMCDTSMCPDQGTTSGSQSSPTNFNTRNLGLAAATARETLLQRGSQRLSLPVDQLVAVDGAVAVRSDRTKRMSYGELIGGQKWSIPLSRTARRKPAAEWTVLGQSIPRVDMASLATGQFEFVHNVHVDGMVHGAVVRPPAVGATLVSVDERSLDGLAGVIKVVVKQNFVGVVCQKPWQAVQAARALKATWTSGSGLPDAATFYDHMRRQPARNALVVDSGDVDRALGQAATLVRSTYLHPYQMHGSMGSSCAVADVSGGRATVWSPTSRAARRRSGPRHSRPTRRAAASPCCSV
jgi:CO/xanthine dehydrogenase Mo-binding subunit